MRNSTDPDGSAPLLTSADLFAGAPLPRRGGSSAKRGEFRVVPRRAPRSGTGLQDDASLTERPRDVAVDNGNSSSLAGVFLLSGAVVMRKLMVAIWCVIPAVAHAQDNIPEQAVKQIYQQCLPTCEAARPYAFCSRTCACVADEMSKHWTMVDFRSKGAALSRDPDDREVRAQIGRIAGFCADRAS